MKKRNYILSILLCISIITGLAGCGLKNNAGNTSASGAGMDGSDSVTGSGVGEGKAAGTGTNQYRYCNDYHLYTQNGKGNLEQRTLAGEKIEEFACGISGADSYWERVLMYVDNQEIFYIIRNQDEDGNPDELWSVPLEKDSHRPLMKNAEKVLEAEKGMSLDYLYADSSYIAYCDLNYAFTEYDRVKKKEIAVDKKTTEEENEREWYSTPDDWDEKFDDSELSGPWSRTILLSRNNVSKNKGPEGLYVHTIGSGKVEKIEDFWDDDYIDPYPAMAPQGDKIAYLSAGDFARGDDRRDELENHRICIYDCKTGKKRKLASCKEIKQLIEREGSAELEFIRNLYIMGNRLYMELDVDMGEDMFGIGQVVSCPLEGEGELRYEKELNQFLMKLEKQKEADELGAYVYDILENRCLLYLVSNVGDTEKYYIWDFETGKGKKREEADSDFYLSYYNARTSELLFPYLYQ
ncbi:MAG: hypothetical protein J1F02_06500 [Lachnospiraceae bacterium]|nr:hypothetical protein [Lachnospiraceae bacterium]